MLVDLPQSPKSSDQSSITKMLQNKSAYIPPQGSANFLLPRQPKHETHDVEATIAICDGLNHDAGEGEIGCREELGAMANGIRRLQPAITMAAVRVDARHPVIDETAFLSNVQRPISRLGIHQTGATDCLKLRFCRYRIQRPRRKLS